MDSVVIYKEKINVFIEKIRNEFFSKENNEYTEIKWWDLCILCIGGYLKEIIELFISTFTNKENIYSLSKTWPFNGPIFWIFIFKALIAGILFIYFGFKLSCSNCSPLTGWYVFIFISWSLLRESIWIFIPNRDAVIFFHFFLFSFFYFWFFFNKDKGNIYDLKLMFYDKKDLYVNRFTGELIKVPGAVRSKEKIKLFTTILLYVFIIMVFSSIISKLIIDWFNKVNRPGESVTSTPKNQKSIQDKFKGEWLIISLSAIIKAPIIEELVFRKCLMRLGNNKLWITFASGFFFALMHLRNESLINILSYLGNGFVLSLLVWLTRNIWFSIFSHSLWNTFGILNLFFRLITGNL